MQLRRIFNGIPLRFYFSTGEVVDVKVNGEKTAYKTKKIEDKLVTTFYIDCSASNIELELGAPLQPKFKVGILKTDHNRNRIVPWTAFVEDYVGIKSEVITNDSKGVEKLKTNDYSLLIAPNVCKLLDEILSQVRTLLDDGCGLIITESFPKTEYLSLNTEEKSSGDFYLNITEDHMSIKPYRKGELIPFHGELVTISNRCKGVIITSGEIKHIKKEGKISKILRGLFPKYIPNRRFRASKRNEERGALLYRDIGNGRVVYFAFDPIQTIALDTSRDKGAQGLAKNFNLIHLMISSFIWASSFIVIKGLYRFDKTPFIYSVDVEASVSYYDPQQRKCSFCVEKGCKDEDTKMEYSLNKSAECLEKFGFIGSFHIDVGGIYEENDERALMKVGKKHDIALHQGPSGNHELWAKNIPNDEWVEVDLDNGIKKIEDVLGHKIRGMRYPAMERNSKTHDVLAKLNLLYDSSSLAWYPYGSIPVRMFNNKEFEPLDLWEIPCFEVINVVKNKPKSLRQRLKVRYEINKILEYVKKCHLNNGIISLLDHDMSIGSNPTHMHGNWFFNKDGFELMMKLIIKSNALEEFWVTKSSEFIEWYSFVRNTNIDINLSTKNAISARLSLRGNCG